MPFFFFGGKTYERVLPAWCAGKRKGNAGVWIVSGADVGGVRHAAADGYFFPLFTVLEDSGYLPRVAFNLTGAFKMQCMRETGVDDVHGIRM